MTRSSLRPLLPSLRPVGSVPSVSGVAALDTCRALREIAGDAAYASALASLPPAIRSELEATTALSWVPNTVLGLVIDTIAHAANREPEAMLDEAVRMAVARTFTTVWRVLLRVTTDAALIARTPIIYARARNVGILSASVVSPGKAALVLADWPEVPARHLRTLAVSIVSVVQLAGRSEVRITWSRTAEGARYLLSWKP